MHPSLRDGDRVKVRPQPVSAPLPAKGTLILIVRNDEAIVHRYAGVIGGTPHEYADHSRRSQPFKRTNLLGIVTHVKRDGRVQRPKIPFRWKLRQLLAGVGDSESSGRAAESGV
jgi:hypothetical protein